MKVYIKYSQKMNMWVVIQENNKGILAIYNYAPKYKFCRALLPEAKMHDNNPDSWTGKESWCKPNGLWKQFF